MQKTSDKFVLEKAIEELDDFFIGNKESILYKFIMAKIEKPLIEKVLEKTHGNQIKAAEILGINRNTLHAKIKKLGIRIRK